jgi:hypothetical protein
MEKLVTASEAAKLLCVSEASFYRHVAQYIPGVNIGGSKRYDVADLRKYVQSMKTGEDPNYGTATNADTCPLTARLQKKINRDAIKKEKAQA